MNTIRIERNVPMRTRDGMVLKSDIYRPDDKEKHPAILTRTPYNKQLGANPEMLDLIETVSAGYVRVIQDVRGRFASEGQYEQGADPLLIVERADGYDAVEWVASQPWCDGNVGMAGASHNGWLQWLAAEESPPHLKAIAPWMCGTAPISEITFLNGVIPLAVFTSLAINLGADILSKLERCGQDVSKARQLLDLAASNPEEVYKFLPLRSVPTFDFGGLREIWNARVINGVPTPELVERAQWSYRKIAVPCFYLSGWYDFFTRGSFFNFQSMRNNGGSELARRGQHLIMGPWTHGEFPNSFGVIGDVSFGGIANVKGAQLTQQGIAFFDKYLRGKDIELPAVRYFLMGSNTWRTAETWPLPDTDWQKFYLRSGGGANTVRGDGRLDQSKPGSEPPDVFTYNPHDPVPTTGGTYAKAIGLVAGPKDQTKVEQRHDVLCYTAPELVEDLEVTGPLIMHLFASTSARDTDFMAKLCDVYPDGRSINIASGIVRARYRKSLLDPQLVNPGEIIEYTINMGSTSQLFRKGHSIRIDITSSNFPEFDRNMNTGKAIGEDAHGIRAKQMVYHQPEYCSYIDLPVIKN